MNTILPQTYLIALVALLFIIAILLGRQLLKVRRDEAQLIKLEKDGANSSKKASDLYELASVQLRKRLYPQASTTLRKALKQMEGQPLEAKALIENALGFALAAQDNFEEAISHYKTALKAKRDYPVALNNLAYAKQKIQKEDEAIVLYQEVLELDSTNKTASKQLKRLRNRVDLKSNNLENEKGFM